jgi:hypothetical protein
VTIWESRLLYVFALSFFCVTQHLWGIYRTWENGSVTPYHTQGLLIRFFIAE